MILTAALALAGVVVLLIAWRGLNRAIDRDVGR